jgi:hypothetical protein
MALPESPVIFTDSLEQASSRTQNELVSKAARVGAQAAAGGGTFEEKRAVVATEIDLIRATNTDGAELATTVALAVLESATGRNFAWGSPTQTAKFRAAVRGKVGTEGVTEKNFDALVKTSIAAAQTFLTDAAAGEDKKNAVVDIMTDLINWSVNEDKLPLTAETGNVLKTLLSQTIEVVFQLLSGQDPDFSAFVTAPQRQALGLLGKLGKLCFGRCRSK